jgi:hypothetical protein
MRVICGFVAAAMLAALAQPALATCVYRGTAKTCKDDPKYWESPAAATEGPEQDKSPTAPAPSLKTMLMQPSASTDNAWVMLPEGGDGATTPVSVMIKAPACEPGMDC